MSKDFRSIYAQGFVRVAASTLHTAIADPVANAAAVVAVAQEQHDAGAALVVLPELTLTGYSIEDLLLQAPLLDAVEEALAEIVQATAALTPILLVGAPLRYGNRVYNTAVVIQGGRVLGVAPKSYIPLYREFYEARQIAAGGDVQNAHIQVAGDVVPFGTDLLFMATDLPGFVLHVEICEDMWVPIPPSAQAALAGATVLANLSGSPITVGRAEDRKLLCRSASSRCLAAYVYAAAGAGESTTDLSWDGQTLIYENGTLLAEGERFGAVATVAVADVDLSLLQADRIRMGTFDDNRRHHHVTAGTTATATTTTRTTTTAGTTGTAGSGFRRIEFALQPPAGDIGFKRVVERFPFVPADVSRLEQDCYEAYNIQVSGLGQRLRAIGNPKVVIGVSGGLDSTHALIVAARAMDHQKRPRTDILAFTLPGFATSDYTRSNATRLAEALGVTFEEIDIRPAAERMLKDLGHPFGRGERVYDITFENVQAGLRTDYLFRAANQRGGIVLGTGDLSELALGWSTYGVGDQMSHYNVNGGVPKTLMQHLIRWVIASRQFDDEVAKTLQAILETEISPELIPAHDGEKAQSTEGTIGPYALHDFSLFYTLRYGLAPSRIAFMAEHAWSDAANGTWPSGYPADQAREYDLPQIRHWLEVFVQKFFSFAQFKRSAMPNGPKVTAGGSLSPRGDWRAPSDASARVWLDELRRNVPAS